MENKGVVDIALQRKPHFFKVLIGDFANQLKFPPNFLKHISSEELKNAILVGPNGCSWSVELKFSPDGTFLSTGWSKFVEDHCLKEREFLVFRYNGKMHFNIQVFDTTACEREDLFDIRPYKKPSMRSEYPVLITNDNYETKILKKGCNTSNIQGSLVTSLSPIKIGKIKSEMVELPFNMDTSKSISGGVYCSKKCPSLTRESSQAFEAAKSFSSDFPSVIVYMTASKVNMGMMRFPGCFSREHLPPEKTNMSMRDPNENVWMVVYIPGNKDRRAKLCGGWSDVVHANCIDEGDFCVFELKTPTEMRVHVFRAF